MKTNILLIALMSISTILFGQVPQGIPYQAVARDAQGNPMANQSLTVQFSLHEASADGQVVYQETQTTTTNGQGLFSLTFGAGAPSVGTFANINWGSGYKFLQVQANFGNGYVDLGTQQLMSVPYALYSGSSGNGSNSSNSNYNPSADSVLTLVGKVIITNGTFTVPQGEVWEIETLNNITGQFVRNFVSCEQFSSSLVKCTYTASSYPVVFGLNDWNFFYNLPNLMTTISVNIPLNWEGSDFCSLCESQYISGFNNQIPSVSFPVHANEGDVITLNGVRASVSKYK